jgi:U3 small nucleolar ribonucleoprotein protein IMP4
MLITTSRKPSQRTRSFCRNLERVLNSKYVNRGKMSIRDVMIKSIQLKFKSTAIVSESKGNPSRIDLYDADGENIISLDVTVSISPLKGRVEKDKLRIRCEGDLKDEIIPLIGIPLEDQKQGKDQEKSQGKDQEKHSNHLNMAKKDSNLVWIKKGDKRSKLVLEFYDSQGLSSGNRVYVHNCRMGPE